MANDTSSSDSKKKGFGRFLPVVIIAIALAGFFGLGLHQYFTLDTLRDNREVLQNWVERDLVLAVAIFIGIYAAAVAISFPGASILTIFGGYLFGLTIGVPAIVVAATLGATIIFLVARSAFGVALADRVSGFAARMERGFREGELSYMFILRLAPVFPFWGVNIAAGVLKVSVRNFVVGTFFGIIPGTFVYASIGNAAGAAFDAGDDISLSGILLKPETLLPIIGLIALALMPVIIRQFTNRADTATDANT